MLLCLICVFLPTLHCREEEEAEKNKHKYTHTVMHTSYIYIQFITNALCVCARDNSIYSWSDDRAAHGKINRSPHRSVFKWNERKWNHLVQINKLVEVARGDATAAAAVDDDNDNDDDGKCWQTIISIISTVFARILITSPPFPCLSFHLAHTYPSHFSFQFCIFFLSVLFLSIRNWRSLI